MKRDIGSEKWETADFSMVFIIVALTAMLVSNGVNEGAK